MEGAEGEVKATIGLPYTPPDYNYRYASIHSCPPWENTEYPALIEKAYGKGKVIWCAAMLEYDDREAFKDIFKGIVERNISKKYTCKAGKAIECVVFEEENASLVSLCDLQYDETKKSGAIPFSIQTKKAPKSFKNVGLNTDMVYTYDEKAGVISAELSVDDFAMFEITY